MKFGTQVRNPDDLGHHLTIAIIRSENLIYPILWSVSKFLQI